MHNAVKFSIPCRCFLVQIGGALQDLHNVCVITRQLPNTALLELKSNYVVFGEHLELLSHLGSI
jgi:hypothetical protein